MKKKLLIIIGIVAIVAIIVAVVVVAMNKNDEKDGEKVAVKSVNLEEVNANISAREPFSEIASEDITTEELANYFQVNTDNVEKVVGKIPRMNVHASMYMLIEAKEGKVEEVKSQVEAYGQSYEAQWEMYLPEQYDLVKDRKIGTVGNCVYLIIAENAEELEALVK